MNKFKAKVLKLFQPNVRKMEEGKNVHGLIKALSSKDNVVRVSACWALGRIKDERAKAGLFLALKDNYMPVHLHAAECLASEGDPRVADVLTQHLKSYLGFNRQEAVKVLHELRDARAVGVLSVSVT